MFIILINSWTFQYVEQKAPCNTWNKDLCASPCDKVKCPSFAKCKDLSNETDPVYECVCQLGTVKKQDGSKCIAPPPQPVTRRPIPKLSVSQKVKLLTKFVGKKKLVKQHFFFCF